MWLRATPRSASGSITALAFIATLVQKAGAVAVGRASGQSGAPTRRDRHVRMIKERGRLGWQRALQYGRRSLVEVAILRYKVLIGRSLRARTLPAQKIEAAIGCKVMNIMTGLDMLVPRKSA